jgi:hypothetical protein
MKREQQKPIVWLLAASVLMTSAAWASPVAITNSGFEDPVLTDGSLGSIGAVPGWSVFNSGTIRVINPSSAADLTAEAPEGANVVLVTSSANEDGLSQTLSSPFQADASYVLSAKVANTKFTSGFPGYRVQLVANGTVLAQDDNSQAVAEDTVVTSTVNYSYNAGLHAGLVGQPLEIRLLSKGLATGEEVAFDDVQLDATLLNPVANPGGPYNVVFNSTLSLDGSASLPSDGQTISTYEWDLDNDGDFDEVVTGATPTAISYATLTAAPPTGYGMEEGANTIKLKVTDSAAKTSTIEGTVNLGGPMVIYEPFADANATLDGNTAGSGLSGNWTAQAAWAVDSGSIPWGALKVSGNQVRATTGGGGGRAVVSPGSTLADTGLLNHGSTLWFSMIYTTTPGATSTNPDAGFALGTATLDGGNNIPMTSAGNGIGFSVKSGQLQATTWVSGALGRSTASNGGEPIANATTYLVVGEIIWGADGAATDTINLYFPDKNLAQGSVVATRSAVLDQAAFSVISYAHKNDSTPAYFDEIRFGASYADVAPADTSPLTLAPSDIVDNKAGGPVLESATLVYTFNFNKTLDPATVDASDFENGGTSPITINSVTVLGNKVTVTVTPAFPGAAGTLQMQVKAGAVISDFAGSQSLNTTSAIADDTVITVNTDTVLPTVVSITSPLAATPIYGLPAIPYVVTFDKYFMDDATVTPADFTNTGNASITVNSVTRTSTGTAPATYAVSVTPTSTGTLQLQLSGTVQDLIGNAVATPVLDDYTYTFASPEPAKQTITVDSVLDISLRYVAGSTKDMTFDASASDKLVVVVTGEHNFGGNLSGDVTSITYDGVSLTKAVERQPFSSTLQTVSELWYLDDPTAATASANAGDPAPATTGSIRIVVVGNGTNYVQTAFGLSGTAPGFGGASSIAIGTQSTNLLVSSPNSKVISWLTLGGAGNTATTAESVLANAPAGAVTFGSKRQPNNYAGHALAHTSGLTPGMNTFSFDTVLTDVYCIAAEFLAADAGGGGNTFADWIATFPGVGGLDGVGDDADGDGIDNGVENFFGTDPSAFSSGLVAGAVGVNTFTFTHPQNATPASDLTAAYQWSKDLATFNADGATDGDNTKVDFNAQLDTPVAGTTTVTATVSGTATSKLFVNVKVTQP